MLGALPSTRVRQILAALVAIFCLVAFVFRWLQDDAFITYRYSRNLASGLGAVWNPGYAVEGYTNFLWMVLLAAGITLGIPAEQATHLLSVPFFGVSLVLTFAIARRVLKDDAWALLATALTGANYSFLMYATGGLETQLNTMLALAALLLTVQAVEKRSVTPVAAAGWSVLVALAMMTRPDSLLLAAVSGSWLCVLAWRAPTTRAQALGRISLLLVPAALILVPWLSWKLHFYGTIFPNTFYVKLGIHRPGTMKRGLMYVAWPFLSFWWLPLIGVALIKLRGRIAFREPAAYPLLAYAVIWLAYAVAIGGDIMEFRQLICVFPLLILALVVGWREAFPSLRGALVLALVLVLGSISHGAFFKYYMRPPGLGNIGILTSTTLRWSEMGRRLQNDLGPDSPVTIAVSPAGAIPYYSGFRTIDVLGLSDIWVARNGYVRQDCDVCLGHLRLAPFDYLKRVGTNLVFGHPQELDSRNPAPAPTAVVEQMFYGEKVDYRNVPDTARLVQIPLSAHESVAALYLQPDPGIDSLIERHVWTAQPLVRSSPLWQ